MILAGFISRWITPWSCMYCRASQTRLAIFEVSAIGSIPDCLHQTVERLALHKLHDNVGPALSVDRDNFQDSGMVQRLPYFFFPFESRIKGGIGFKIHQWNFTATNALFAVHPFKNGAHAAAMDRLDNFKAIVEHLPRFDFGRHAIRVSPAFCLDKAPTVHDKRPSGELLRRE